MKIAKLIDTLQSYKNKVCDNVLISNDNFSINQVIKRIEIDKSNSKQINLIIDNICICDALKVIKKYKNTNETIKI